MAKEKDCPPAEAGRTVVHENNTNEDLKISIKDTALFRCILCGAEIRLPDTLIFRIQGYCNECKRDTIFKKVGAEPPIELFFEDKEFIPKNLADFIMEDRNFITFSDTDELYVYIMGIYCPGGESLVKGLCEKYLGKEANTRRVNEVINHIKRSTYIKRNEIDSDIELLCVQNGILNIKTLELTPHTPNIVFLNKIPVNYNPNADCPRIKQFISEIVKESDILLIQEMIGYTLWRNYNLDKAFLLIGEGDNGKSTLLGLLAKFLGKENVSSISLQDLDTNRFAIAEFYGKLANIYADLTDRALNHTGKFKMLTGGDIISAERKFKGQFLFNNHAKLIFSCNKVPESRDDTTAFYRRWIMINFPNKFEGENRNPNILEGISTEEELSGLLNWALEGLRRLLKNGHFSNSITTEEIREQYIKQSNPVLAFVEDRLISDSKGEISKDELYRAFCDYCEEVGLPTKAKNVFGRELPRYIAVDSGQTREKGHIWRGIRLVNTDMENNDREEERLNGLDGYYEV